MVMQLRGLWSVSGHHRPSLIARAVDVVGPQLIITSTRARMNGLRASRRSCPNQPTRYSRPARGKRATVETTQSISPHIIHYYHPAPSRFGRCSSCSPLLHLVSSIKLHKSHSLVLAWLHRLPLAIPNQLKSFILVISLIFLFLPSIAAVGIFEKPCSA